IVDAPQQVGEASAAAVWSVVLVAVHRLAKKRDFLASLVGELEYFSRDLLRRPALLGAADAGDDAIRAEFVAADHDADVGLEAGRPHRRIAERVVAFKALFDFMARTVR